MSPEDLRVLASRRDRVLARMVVISEAPASRAPTVNGHIRSGGGAGPPVGVRLERIRSQRECPDKDRSLFDFYAWQFAHAKTTEELVTLCFLAEKDLKARTVTGESTAERHRARNRSILSSKYIDQPPAVVAAAEDCTEKHVRTWRKKNGLDATTARHLR